MAAIPGSVRPADGAPLPPVAAFDLALLADVVEAARRAQVAWRTRPQRERNDAIRAIAREIIERRVEIGQIIAEETGRTVTDAVVSEVVFVVDNVEAAIRVAEAALAPQPVRLSALDFPGKRIVVEAVPRGVVSIIAPWNYPLANFYKSLWPALLAGNAVLLKPSEFTPRVGAWLAEVLHKHVPAELAPCLQGGGELGAALLPVSDAVVFTGSLATGRRVAARAGELLIPCSVELGGKDAAIVLADCDLDRTVAGICFWAFHNAGQDCGAVERVYVEAAIADRFVEAVARAAARVRVADGTGAAAEIGPVQNEAQLALIEAHLADAVARGARIVCGGARTGSGYGFAATVVDGCTDDMRLFAEETFGPVLAIARIADAEEGIARANASAYGLCGSVWTGDVARGETLARRISAGSVMVNNHAFTGTLAEVPWSGLRGSGTGVAMSAHAYGTFVQRRTVLVDRNRAGDPWWFPAGPDLDAFVDAVARKSLGSFGAILSLLPLLGRRSRAIRRFGRGEG